MEKDLGTIIRELRIELGYSQPHLASLIGVSKGMISHWENNANEPTAKHIRALALCFDVSADYILGIKEN